jgi:hypothetical protein
LRNRSRRQGEGNISKDRSPLTKQFEKIIANNLITSFPVTVDDAKRAILMYGPDLTILKVKATRGQPTPHVTSFIATSIPAPILEFHKDVTLCVDFFFVQGQTLFHVISRKIQHRVVTPVNDRNKANMTKCIDSALRLYRLRGFHITDIHADNNEFECVREHILLAHLNTVAADAHVGEVEKGATEPPSMDCLLSDFPVYWYVK